MKSPRPLLVEGGSAARTWSRLSASGAAVLAITGLGILFLIAALAPLLSEDRPLIIALERGRSYPLFSAMTRLDILWFFLLLAALGGFLVRRFGASWGAACLTSLVFATGGIALAARHEPRHETRRYRLEEMDRALVAAGDGDLQVLLDGGREEEARALLRGLGRSLGGSLDAQIEVEQRLDLLRDRAPNERHWALRALMARNELELERLREAVYPLNRFAPDQPSYSGLTGPEGPGGHRLGSDREGRDLLARLIYGTRLAMTVALGSSAIIALLGLFLGLLGGWFGGMLDWWLERLSEVVLCLPVLFVLVAFAAYLPLELRGSALVMATFIGLVAWPTAARLVRAEVLRTKNKDFILAAVAMGLSRRRILLRHLLPNILGSVLIASSLAAGQVIMVEATLSFLGLGVHGAPSWGRILAESREAALLDSAWHLAVFPGLLVFAAVLAFNILGDRLRDALDPRS